VALISEVVDIIWFLFVLLVLVCLVFLFTRLRVFVCCVNIVSGLCVVLVLCFLVCG